MFKKNISCINCGSKKTVKEKILVYDQYENGYRCLDCDRRFTKEEATGKSTLHKEKVNPSDRVSQNEKANQRKGNKPTRSGRGLKKFFAFVYTLLVIGIIVNMILNKVFIAILINVAVWLVISAVAFWSYASIEIKK